MTYSSEDRFSDHAVEKNAADGQFPVTRWSAIVAARSQDATERERALETLLTAYWKAVYKYVRLRWNRPAGEAEDLTQGFFVELLERDFLARYDRAKSRLRTYLRLCVDSYVMNTEKAAHRQKRGGGAVHVALDFSAAEEEVSRTAFDPARLASPEGLEEFFEKEWVRSLFGAALEQMERECEARRKGVHFRLFEQYDLEDSGERRLSYGQLARQNGLSVTEVTNYLAWARREFRRMVLERLRELCGDEEEFRREARAVLGFEPR